MIKPKQPFFKVKTNSMSRKPSLPIKRTSSIQSNLSNQSCMSDRIIYHKNSQSELYSDTKRQDYNLQESSSRLQKKKKVSKPTPIKKQTHSLTSFQWLLIMRHLFHLENKKRSTLHIKQRTLLNYIKNKMYPDSIWNKVMVIHNQNKFTTQEITETIEKYGKSKLALDDLLSCAGKMYEKPQSQEPVETARFVDQIKPIDDERKHNMRKNIKLQTIESKQLSPMMEDISPISNNNLTNNISFSMDYDSQQSHFSQSAQTKFDLALNALEHYKNKTNQEIVKYRNFIQKLINYSLYMYQKTQYIYGVKLNQSSCSGLPSKQLQTALNTQEISQYLSCIHGFQLVQLPSHINQIIPHLSQSLKILNISHNQLRGVSFLKDHRKYSQLQFININHNRINNISDLMSLPKLTQLHAKHNNIDHISISAKENGGHELRLLDLGWNQITKEEDLWSLRNLEQVRMINLAGNKIMKGHKWMGLIKKELILNYEDIYIFSQYSQYKDIAFHE